MPKPSSEWLYTATEVRATAAAAEGCAWEDEQALRATAIYQLCELSFQLRLYVQDSPPGRC